MKRAFGLVVVAALVLAWHPAAAAAKPPAPTDPHSHGRGPAATDRARTSHSNAHASRSGNPLLKEVLAEGDEDQGDEPAAGALCQSFIGQPNPYRNPAPNV